MDSVKDIDFGSTAQAKSCQTKDAAPLINITQLRLSEKKNVYNLISSNCMTNASVSTHHQIQKLSSASNSRFNISCRLSITNEYLNI